MHQHEHKKMESKVDGICISMSIKKWKAKWMEGASASASAPGAAGWCRHRPPTDSTRKSSPPKMSFSLFFVDFALETAVGGGDGVYYICCSHNTHCWKFKYLVSHGLLTSPVPSCCLPGQVLFHNSELFDSRRVVINNLIILKFKNWKWICVSNGFGSGRALLALGW